MVKIGQRIGKLVVSEETDKRYRKKTCCEKLWLCRCDCGGERLVRTGQITRGTVTSCGCKGTGPDRDDSIVGKTIGIYKVGDFIRSDRYRRQFYKCECLNCGAVVEVDRKSIKNNQSCSECRWESSHLVTSNILRIIRDNANARGIEFSVDQEFLQGLLDKQNSRCALSGVEIWLDRAYTGRKTASLDRIDSAKGYVPGNIQWVHKDVNKMKGNLSEERFFELCSLISNKKGK